MEGAERDIFQQRGAITYTYQHRHHHCSKYHTAVVTTEELAKSLLTPLKAGIFALETKTRSKCSVRAASRLEQSASRRKAELGRSRNAGDAGDEAPAPPFGSYLGR